MCSFELNIKKSKKRSRVNFEELEENAKRRWNKIIEFMLNLVREQDMENKNIIELLERSKYVEKRGGM
jgi:Na+/phosphate symporter